MLKHPNVILIYDGQCRFCAACLAWVEQKLQITSLAFQDANLDNYGLIRSQCEESVFVINKEVRFSGAVAVSYLLKLRGNTFFAWVIESSGRIGQSGYRWVASHRDSLIIRIVTRHLERVVSRKG
ncbi:MAG: DCC1-like thiol-disulfide oxidoreductase family protein [Actinomycetes bacterium]